VSSIGEALEWVEWMKTVRDKVATHGNGESCARAAEASDWRQQGGKFHLDRRQAKHVQHRFATVELKAYIRRETGIIDDGGETDFRT
jgi:hypothetical protein